MRDGEVPTLLTLQDLRQLLPMLGEDAIYGLLKSGELAARKVGGKWVTTPDAVDAWLDLITAGGRRGDSLRVVP